MKTVSGYEHRQGLQESTELETVIFFILQWMGWLFHSDLH